MSAEQVAYATLSAAAAVTALVDTRIYPDFVPQEKTLPAVAMARASTEYVTTIHSGLPAAAIVNLELWCMAASRAAAEDLATKVIAALAPVTNAVIERLPEFDAETEVFATVVTVVFLE